MATQTIASSPKSGRGLGLVICVLFIAAVAGYALITATRHASQPRVGEVGIYASRGEIWDSLEAALQSGYGKDGCKIKSALCLFATINDLSSPNYGLPSPQIKVACCKNSFCAVGSVGLRNPSNPVLISAQYMDEARFDRTCTRDKCVITDISTVNGYINRLTP